LKLYHDHLGRNVFFYGSKNDLEDVLSKLSVWIIIGWTYNFFILIKDDSECLDSVKHGIAFTYREWVKYDGIFTVTIFGLIFLLATISIIT
jgi:hypothetical protein